MMVNPLARHPLLTPAIFTRDNNEQHSNPARDADLPNLQSSQRDEANDELPESWVEQLAQALRELADQNQRIDDVPDRGKGPDDCKA